MSSSQCHQALPGHLAVLRETDTRAASHVLTKGSCRGPAHSGSSALGDFASPTVDKGKAFRQRLEMKGPPCCEPRTSGSRQGGEGSGDSQPAGLARSRREKVVPGDAGEAGHGGKVGPDAQPLTGCQQLHGAPGLAQRCVKSRVEQGRWVGGEAGVSRGMLWWVGLRGEPMTCWRGEYQA